MHRLKRESHYGWEWGSFVKLGELGQQKSGGFLCSSLVGRMMSCLWVSSYTTESTCTPYNHKCSYK